MNTEHRIKVCNHLLRGERSAIETYDRAIAALHPLQPEIAQIRQEHVNAIISLEQNVLSMGGTPDLESGVWGDLANTVQATADVLGKKSTLISLETGEKSGKSDYESALQDDEVMPECKNLIRSTLLPRIEEHINALERLQKAA